MNRFVVIVFILFYLGARDVLSVMCSEPEVVINEVFYDPPGKDTGCFVELLGPPGLKLDDYFLVGVNGGSGKEYNRIDLSGYKIPSDGYFVVAQDENEVPNADMVDSSVDYQNGPDNIELWYKDGKIDSVGYGNFSEAVFTGEKAPTLDLSGYSIGRRPDGFDSNDNSVDFVGLAVPSPGAPNLPGVAVVKTGKLLSKWGSFKKIYSSTILKK